MSEKHTAHTPGPWTVRAGILSAHDGDYVIGTVNCWSEDHPEEAEANARLIAASPAMLEALKTAVALLAGHGKPADPSMLAAIALATNPEQSA